MSVIKSRMDTAEFRRRTAEVAERLDVTLIFTASALTIIGLVMTLSASSALATTSTGSAFTLFTRQGIWTVLGMAALFGFSRVDYHRLRTVSYALVLLIWVALAITLIPGIGLQAYGAQRWIQVGPLSLQPSEGAKLILLVFGADVLSRKEKLLSDWRHVMLPHLAAVGVTCMLVLMQPDFGTMVIVATSGMLLAFIAGAEPKFLGGLTVTGVILGIPVMLAEGYRRDRFLAFLNGKEDSLNGGYQSAQGLIALGSGRFFGMGLGSSRQKYLYLPNAHTDFIFAILGEETGLAGTITVLILFGLLAVVGVKIARNAPDAFGYLLAAGITGWISLQVLINIGAVTGLLPITGVPLPLVSFGGTSLLFSLAGLGIVASVARHSVTKPKSRRSASA